VLLSRFGVCFIKEWNGCEGVLRGLGDTRLRMGMIDAGDELFGRCCGVVSCPRSAHGLMMWRELLGLLLVVGIVISIFERPSIRWKLP
jgi:hypothetical protein